MRPIDLIRSLLLFMAVTAIPLTAASADEAVALRDQAAARIERFVDYFRRTFDGNALRHELDQAAAELQESIRLFGERGDHREMALALVKLGDLNRYREQWDSAIGFYEQAARTARKASAHLPEGKALLGHARSLLYGKRAPGPAAALVEHAVSIAPQTDDPSYLFDALDLRSQVEIAQGDLIAAADSLNRALSLSDAFRDEKLLFYGYLDRADVYQKLAEKCDYERTFEPCLEAIEHARADYVRALDIARKLGWIGLAEQTLGILQRLRIREELIHAQQRLHRTVTESGIFAPQSPGEVLVTEQFATGENPQLSGLLAWIETQGGMPVATDARGAYVQGLMNEMSGANEQALEWYLRAVELLENDRRFLHEERSRGRFLEDKIEFYYTAMLHLLDRGKHEAAFELLERSRSRTMADLLATKALVLSSPTERALFASALELRSQIALRQRRLFELRNALNRQPGMQTTVSLPGDSADFRRGTPLFTGHASIAELEHELERLENEHETMTRRIHQQTPRLASLVVSEPTSLKALQRRLAADRSDLLIYVTLESQLIVWHIGPRSVQVRSVFLPRSELKRKVGLLRKSLIDPQRPFDRKLARELMLFLIAPVLRWVETDHLIIVAHEDLHYLPFQVLPSATEPQQFLGEQYQISYAPSATVLRTLPAPEPLAGHRILALADPSLVHARTEVRDIGERYPGRIEADELATEAQVKSWVSDRDLVHFAVHGRFVSDEPLLSHLHLQSGGAEDGQLTAAEMYGLPLDAAQLVVLSACETGTVRATHANELLGMMRGLLFAGADALLLSAWPIDDEATATWMHLFYQNATQVSAAQAARSAIRSMREQPSYQHPFYWGPFLLVSR